MNAHVDETHVYFRVDASSRMGTGHFMRCLALAQYFRDQNRGVTFIGQFPRSLAQRLEREGISTHGLTAPHPDPADAKEVLALIQPHAAIVLDGYHFDPQYQSTLASEAQRLLIIDDTGHLDGYNGDVLLNQNVNAEDVIYLNAPSKQLLGTRYALLGRALRHRHSERNRPLPRVARNILITMGGADPNNDTAALLDEFAKENHTSLNIRIVAGAANPHQAQLRQFCALQGPNYDLVVDTDDMPALMIWADIAIAASGTTSWELAYLGVPSIFVAIAPNQEAIGEGIESRGAGVYIGRSEGIHWGQITDAALSLAQDSRRRSNIRDAATDLVDGDGVVRVAASLMNNE